MSVVPLGNTEATDRLCARVVEQQERMLDRCEAFDAANPDPETDT